VNGRAHVLRRDRGAGHQALAKAASSPKPMPSNRTWLDEGAVPVGGVHAARDQGAGDHHDHEDKAREAAAEEEEQQGQREVELLLDAKAPGDGERGARVQRDHVVVLDEDQVLPQLSLKSARRQGPL
jgi:hypothetical protein